MESEQKISKSLVLAEGKTKVIWTTKEDSQAVIVENKDDITAFDDPSFTRNFATKAKYATETTCRVFELLKKAGLPVAYNEQLSSTEFLAPKCEMIPLEVVIRRYAPEGSSYLGRNPQFAVPEGKTPHRFHRLKVEFFLKTTKGKLVKQDGKVIVEGLDSQKKEEDPLIANPYDGTWTLLYSKKPAWDPNVVLREGIKAADVLGSEDTWKMIDRMDCLIRQAFLALEGAWANLGCRLIDLKLEFAFLPDGTIVIADVIDNDNWRLRDFRWNELSKESFRQGETLDEVERKYGIVARLVNNFRVPEQCLLLWKGSDKDASTSYNSSLLNSGIRVESVILSGHKSPRQVLARLEEILARYPDGGVIIVKVGRSNGLGPILAARTTWPVVSVCASFKDFPDDIWSSLRMPSQVPMGTFVEDSTAIDYAVRILAQKNPILYMQAQYEAENLDE